MFVRFSAAVLVTLLAPATLADVVITKRGKVHGIRSRIDGVEITKDNVQSYLDQSTGVIVRHGYDAIEIKKRERDRRGIEIELDDVADYFHTERPEALLDGLDNMQLGAYPQAIGAFREVLESDARQVFKDQADYNLGLCYYLSGNVRNCIAHWSAWTPRNSRFTPVVYSNLAEIQTLGKKFKQARALYKRITELEGIPENWKLTGELGDAKVDIAERNFRDAEQTAKRIAARASRPELTDARALGLTLQAQAIYRAETESQSKERLPEAQRLLGRAEKLAGVSKANRAFLFSTLGNVVYAQGNPEDARYPYLRVVCLFPDTGYVAAALQNAGNCFIDMSLRLLDKEPAKSDEYLVKGMKLLYDCAARHKGTPAGRGAAKVYREHKKRYEKILAEEEKGTEKTG